MSGKWKNKPQSPIEGVESLRGLISPYILQTEAQMFIDSWQFMSEVLWRAIGNGNDDLSHLSVERRTTEGIENKEHTQNSDIQT